MRKMSAGQAVQVVANVGVIATILFLAIELRQNNELLDAQTQADLFDRITGFPEEIVRTLNSAPDG